MMDEIPDRPKMVLPLLRKRQRFAYQTTDPLPERVVQAFDMARLAAFLADWTVPLPWQDTRIGIPKITGTDRTLPLHGRQRCPEVACGCFVPRPDGYSHNFPRITVKRQPEPLVVVVVANERPQFSTFNGQAALFFDRTRTARGTLRYCALTYGCNQLSET